MKKYSGRILFFFVTVKSAKILTDLQVYRNKRLLTYKDALAFTLMVAHCGFSDKTLLLSGR
jgi:hypothetical protein